MKSHYGFLETKIKQLRTTWKRAKNLRKKIINFPWPDDDTFKEWKDKYMVQEVEAQE